MFRNMMILSNVLILLALLASSDARRLKGSKDDKKKSKTYKGTKSAKFSVQIGDRPYYILDSLKEGELKDQLTECAKDIKNFEKSDWSIGHRGACLLVR
mmetsp:Transcript_2573/g.4817  ORF Transcript_2573/g.4817 Transcript_2573/m.4817 type:complete len:99 (-) Transcript_2573:1014-1310(-)